MLNQICKQLAEICVDEGYVKLSDDNKWYLHIPIGDTQPTIDQIKKMFFRFLRNFALS
jgi:hypothetical protein